MKYCLGRKRGPDQEDVAPAGGGLQGLQGQGQRPRGTDRQV